MWFAGIMEGLMWRAYNDFGFLEYSFVETVEAKHISYVIRMAGGLLYFGGALIMAYNLVRTAIGHERINQPAGAPAVSRPPAAATSLQPAE